MTPNELRERSDAALKALMIELHREKFNLRMQKTSGGISKPDRVKKIRREIARINTILTEKSRAAV
jgi:large subunit ribosomal protein L29